MSIEKLIYILLNLFNCQFNYKYVGMHAGFDGIEWQTHRFRQVILQLQLDFRLS